ncbi:I78 family peptidase inhibitor [Sphingomonas sp. GC_Shp_4]|uniref:I78 family peptidase inhibitor n=2 Tax=Sphingomonas TaxID=13687 RepID=UPI00226B3B8D|nr:I78 family peptidase inhibitor [Sphingomonas sp. GC_Shp_4]
MRTYKAIMVAALLGLTALGACATTGPRDHAGAATCRAAAAAKLVGQVAPDDAVILRRTGGTTVRRLAPGDMSTKDYREERVTVTIAEGRVISASCG